MTLGVYTAQNLVYLTCSSAVPQVEKPLVWEPAPRNAAR